MTHTTQPSSTPITAEGAVLALRASLIEIQTLCNLGFPHDVIGRRADKCLSYEAAARAALAATDPAAIQPAGEAYQTMLKYAVVRDSLAEIREWALYALQDGRVAEAEARGQFHRIVESCNYAISKANAIPLRAPQDAKAEQVWTADEIANACRDAGLGIFECNALIVKIKEDPAPAASNVEAVSEPIGPQPEDFPDATDHYGIDTFYHKPTRKSAPIEAGEMPPLPQPTIEGSVMHPELKICYRAPVHFTADQMTAYGQLCRDTARPASSATKPASTGSIAADRAFQEALSQYKGGKAFEYRNLIRAIDRHIDARQSVAAPEAVQGKASDAEDGWINVDARMPDDNQDVIVLFWPYDNRENAQIVGQACHIEGVFYNHEGDDHHYPSHWMPMPANDDAARAQPSGEADHG